MPKIIAKGIPKRIAIEIYEEIRKRIAIRIDEGIANTYK